MADIRTRRCTTSPDYFRIALCDLLKNHKNEKSESFLARSFLLKMLRCAARDIMLIQSVDTLWDLGYIAQKVTIIIQNTTLEENNPENEYA